MGRWRDIKRAAKESIHATMAVPAVYLTSATAAPVRVEVRVNVQIGPADFGDQYSSFVDLTPRLVFDTAVVPRPLARALTVLSASEMYRIAVTRPPRDGFVAAEVVPLSEVEQGALLAAIAPDWPDVSALDAAWEGIL